jgi:hypothetical protein
MSGINEDDDDDDDEVAGEDVTMLAGAAAAAPPVAVMDEVEILTAEQLRERQEKLYVAGHRPHNSDHWNLLFTHFPVYRKTFRPWYTIIWLAVLAATAVAGAVDPDGDYWPTKGTLRLDWDRVVSHGEYWRLVTTFVCFGGQLMSPRTALAAWMVFECGAVERAYRLYYRGSQFAVTLLAGACLLLALDLHWEHLGPGGGVRGLGGGAAAAPANDVLDLYSSSAGSGSGGGGRGGSGRSSRSSSGTCSYLEPDHWLPPLFAHWSASGLLPLLAARAEGALLGGGSFWGPGPGEIVSLSPSDDAGPGAGAGADASRRRKQKRGRGRGRKRGRGQGRKRRGSDSGAAWLSHQLAFLAFCLRRWETPFAPAPPFLVVSMGLPVVSALAARLRSWQLPVAFLAAHYVVTEGVKKGRYTAVAAAVNGTGGGGGTPMTWLLVEAMCASLVLHAMRMLARKLWR